MSAASQGDRTPAIRRARKRRAWLFRIALSCAALPLAAGEAPWQRRSATTALGVVKPEGLGYGPWLAAGFSQPVGPLSIGPELGYWSRSETAFGLQASVSDLQVGLNLVLTPLTIGTTRLFVGTGAAVHRIEIGAESGAASTSDTRTYPGVMVVAGLERQVAKTLSVFAAGRCDFILKEDRDDRDWRFFAGVRLKI